MIDITSPNEAPQHHQLSGTAVPLVAVDHIVMKVDDVEATAAWWQHRFDVAVERLDEWRSGDAPFPWVRLTSTLIVDLWAGEPDGTNVDHVAFVTDPASFDAFVAARSDEVEMGPAEMGGAQGQGHGIYLRDPSNNRIELRTYR